MFPFLEGEFFVHPKKRKTYNYAKIQSKMVVMRGKLWKGMV